MRTAAIWVTRRHRFDLLSRVLVMGIVNLTPDSFSEVGGLVSRDAALRHGERLLAEGADLLDLGAESTRPGAVPVGADEELARLLPVLERAVEFGCPISVDTSKAVVMSAALRCGADVINDVRALRAPDALATVAAHPNCGVCVMHMRGDSAAVPPRVATGSTGAFGDGRVSAALPAGDVVSEVRDFLGERLRALNLVGIEPDRIVLDPGIGFGKTADENLVLLQRQAELTTSGRPLLVGWSRKSTLGILTGRDVTRRVTASAVAALAAVQRGARILRVHDVAATVDALRVWEAAGLGIR